VYISVDNEDHRLLNQHNIPPHYHPDILHRLFIKGEERGAIFNNNAAVVADVGTSRTYFFESNTGTAQQPAKYLILKSVQRSLSFAVRWFVS